MKSFLDSNFLLQSETAQKLYHEHAAKMPIIDYHCHLIPQQIADNYQFADLTEIWLGGDHYKWRAMRANGVPETYITGDKPAYEKFEKWAETLQYAMRNPLYHWTHLELSRIFGIDKVLNPSTAREIYDECTAKLQTPEFRAQAIMERMNVEVVCTTDDPIDDLKYHTQIRQSSLKTKVLPAWRPDKAMAIENVDTYNEYLTKLEAAADMSILNFKNLIDALQKRHDFFASQGCRLSDHALEYVMYVPADEKTVEAIFAKRLSGQQVTREEELTYKTAFMGFVGREYKKLDWAMQLHYGCKRNNNGQMFRLLGPDTGYDCINNYAPSAQLADFLGAFADSNELPRTIVYSLNPADDAVIESVIGCFQNSDAVGKVQHGSAWWFNDHIMGMRQQIMTLASQGRLAGFVGMLTDSRSFLSYPRHEYFRRILCDYLGDQVENGLFPDDRATLGRIVQDISYNNADHYFKFPRK